MINIHFIQIFLDVHGAQFILILLATVFTFIVLLLAAVQWFHVWMYVAEEKRQNKLYFLLSLFPVIVLISFLLFFFL